MISKRGRKSSADLMTPRPLQVYPRQPLPPELSGDEAEVFLEIVNTEEGGWLNKGSVPVLTQYCRHVVQARRVAELLEAAVGQDHTSWQYYTQLLVQQRAESAAIAALSVKLRLAPSSARKNRGSPKSAAPPWEYDGAD